MTTPNTDLQEEIARALYNNAEYYGPEDVQPEWEHRGDGEQDEWRQIAAAILPVVEEHTRAAAKAAWDECAQEQGGWPRPEGNPRALTYVLLANNPYMPKGETLGEQ